MATNTADYLASLQTWEAILTVGFWPLVVFVIAFTIFWVIPRIAELVIDIADAIDNLLYARRKPQTPARTYLVRTGYQNGAERWEWR